MNRWGKFLFFAGVIIAVTSGLLMSLDLGAVCRLKADAMPDRLLSYPALCFLYWTHSVPVGIILAAAGVLASANAGGRAVGFFLIAMIAVFLFVTFANGPVPHVPPLFGIGGALILLFYFLILWHNRTRFADNRYSLAGYTFLLIGLWYTCGLGSRQYVAALANGESPIDIMFYFVMAMAFFWLGERRLSDRH